MSSDEGRVVDTGQPLLLWEPDPACDHTENEDCAHSAIRVATRVASNTLARGTMVLELRELREDDDDFGYVAVADDIVLTCALDSGRVEPRGREAEIFLRHHPWLVDSLRVELEFLRGRASRVAAQLVGHTATVVRASAAQRGLPLRLRQEVQTLLPRRDSKRPPITKRALPQSRRPESPPWRGGAAVLVGPISVRPVAQRTASQPAGYRANKRESDGNERVDEMRSGRDRDRVG